MAADQYLKGTATLLKYEPNPTVYQVQRGFRFIRTEINSEQKRVYQLQSIGSSLVIKDLLRSCRSGRSYPYIVQRIAGLANCSQDEATDYFEFLNGIQLLVTVHRANINGREHLRILAETYPNLLQPDLFRLLSFFGNQAIPSVERLKQLNNRLDQFLKGKKLNDETAGINLTLSRRLAVANLADHHQQQIMDGLFALQCLGQRHEVGTLTQFARNFHKHFEGQRIPLLLALDPERGVGYQQAEAAIPNPLLETVNIYPRTVVTNQGQWEKGHTYLLQRWLKMEREGGDTIRLEEDDLRKLRSEGPMTGTFGFSVLFRIAGDNLYLESAGGTNAPAMLGRFTVTDADLAEHARAMAREVEALNPELLFAELLHLTDPHTDNINRRAKIWSYEIPLTAGADRDTQTLELRLDDLYVEVIAQRILLWSKTHNRYVIPRLTSAYNHSIDQLPLFRFLADLSYQDGAISLNFDLTEHFPGLSHYPRVTYGRTIIGLATWVFVKDQLSNLFLADERDLPKVFQQFAIDHRLPEIFSFSEGDQQLVFYRDVPEDALFFVESVRTKESIRIMEFLIDSAGSVYNDLQDQPYLNQFNAYLLPEEPLPMPPVSIITRQLKEKRKFIPGSEWLYLKLYVPRLGAGRILLKIWPLLKRSYPHGKIQQWFFIRYEDHAPHIRLRLKIDPLDINNVLFAFRSVLEGHIHEQVIREYQVDVYSRELERYFAGGIEASEHFFAASSHFVLCYLDKQKKTAMPAAYLVALVSTHAILNYLIPQTDERISYLQTSYEGLASEFEGKRMKYELDQKFRSTRSEIASILATTIPFGTGIVDRAYRSLINSARTLKGNIEKHPEHRIGYIQSILHMHMNRVFTDHQRKQEMLVYYLLYKYQTALQARSKKNAT